MVGGKVVTNCDCCGGNGGTGPGGCCTAGTCSIKTYLDCIDGGGSYLGEGTTCDGVDCFQGGCCIAGGCSVRTLADCNSLSGHYLGDGTTCDGVDCTHGACCTTGAACGLTTSAGCTGRYQGDGSDCFPNPCGAICAGAAGVTLTELYTGFYASSRTSIHGGISYSHLAGTLSWSGQSHRDMGSGNFIDCNMSGSMTRSADFYSGTSCSGSASQSVILKNVGLPDGSPPCGVNIEECTGSAASFNPCGGVVRCLPCGSDIYFAHFNSTGGDPGSDTFTFPINTATFPSTSSGSEQFSWAWSEPCPP
jgi:hypothetical protein